MLEDVTLQSRREFLKSGSAALLAAAASTPAFAHLQTSPTVATTTATRQPAESRSKKCILLFLNGAPSQLETFDPKPNAPLHVRGPFGAIATAVPGLHLSSTLPRLAQLADRFAIVRSVTWDGPAIHDAGADMLLRGSNGQLNPTPTLTELLELTDPGAACLINSKCELITPTQDSPNRFGACCSRASQLISGSTRFVVVNMFPQLHGRLTWDCHADAADLPTRLQDYGDVICPQFDMGCATLLNALDQTGELDDTLVIAVGEFGRASQINSRGGRGHSTAAWSALIAGGGVHGGALLGQTDGRAADVIDDPVSPAHIFSLMRQHLGIPRQTSISAQEGRAVRAEGIGPLANLFT